MTVADLERRMSARELADWQKYWASEPWGAYRDNLHAGLIASAVLMPHVGKGKKAPTFKDFLLKDADAVEHDKQTETRRTLATLRALAKRKPKHG